MPFWSSVYQPIPQDEKVSDSEAAPDLSDPRTDRQTNREKWLGRILLCVAAGNLLVAFATVIATRDISKLRIPLAGVDISALPRPDPYVGLNLIISWFHAAP
ncbi:hypothetical protein DFH08DRAFT_977867 [Mycena albidolilacea]|uniref:Uncharacterized protein n=1 Tax=Mycena albidolilacea TaxID=1033008 RepID=A0AAD6Z0E3_9AGAR|nr:hypothetical protein DFH08DRAFT_977867 [Mycena albidolilacea]